MTYETTFHIRRIAESQWQIAYYQGAIQLDTVVVERQADIGHACDSMYEKHSGIKDDETQISDLSI